MSQQYIAYSSRAGSGVQTYANFAAFPASASDGTLALALDTDTLYAYNAGSTSWVAIASPSAVLSIGTFDSGTPSANGAHIDLDALIMQSASASNPGLVNTGTQTMAGNKTFTGTISASNLSGTNTGDVTLGAVGASPNANAASLSGQVLTLQPASASFPGVITTGSQSIAGSKTFSNLVNADGGIDRSNAGTLTIGATNSSIINIGNSGATVNIQGTTIYENTPQLLTADPLITVNHGGGAGSGQNSGIEVEENAIITGYCETSSDRNSWILKAPNTAGIATITPGAGGITLDQSSHNPVTLTAVGSSPNANGASLATQALTLQPANASFPGVLLAADWTTFNNKQATISIGALDAQAANANGLALVSNVLSTQSADATHPGMVNNTTQSFSGNKTFTGTISASNLSGTNTGDVTLAAVGSSPNANAASLSGQVLNLQPADASNPGVMTTGTQTIAGAKTFSGGITATVTGTASGNTTISGQTNHGVVIASATNAMTSTGAGTSGQVLTSNGASADPTFQAAPAGASSFNMTAQTTTYSAVINDYVTVTKGSAWTITLPTAVGQSGKAIRIVITDNTPSNALTINTTSAQTISGYASGVLKMYTQYEFTEFTSDGSNWVISDRRADTPWAAYTPTLTGFGTTTNASFIWRRNGNNLEVNGSFTTGTPSGTHEVTLPSGPLIDITTMSHSASVGLAVSAASGASTGFWSSNRAAILFSDGASTTSLFFANTGASGAIQKSTGASWVDSSVAAKLNWVVPIANWGW